MSTDSLALRILRRDLQSAERDARRRYRDAREAIDRALQELDDPNVIGVEKTAEDVRSLAEAHTATRVRQLRVILALLDPQ